MSLIIGDMHQFNGHCPSRFMTDYENMVYSLITLIETGVIQDFWIDTIIHINICIYIQDPRLNCHFWIGEGDDIIRVWIYISFISLSLKIPTSLILTTYFKSLKN